MQRSTEKYLNSYAADLGFWKMAFDPQSLAYQKLFLDPHKIFTPFSSGVIIPCRGEGRDLIHTLNSIELATQSAPAFAKPTTEPRAMAHHRIVVVLVINGSEDDRLLNAESFRAASHFAPSILDETITHGLFIGRKEKLTLLIHRLENLERERSHVGRARKWAADFLVRMHALGLLSSPFIRSLDADTLVGPDYFRDPTAEDAAIPAGTPRVPVTTAKLAAFTYRVKHQKAENPELQAAIDDYELFLQSYVDGLRSAGSPYGHHSIGSAFAFHADRYADVRGFPEREAGEDFYLLNKLRKVGRIGEVPAQVFPAARLSMRVPFGTGPALSKILQDRRAGISTKLYQPHSFQRLREVLDGLSQWARGEMHIEIPYLTPAMALRLRLSLKGRTFVQDREKALQDAFDGLKTLQFIRACEKDMLGFSQHNGRKSEREGETPCRVLK